MGIEGDGYDGGDPDFVAVGGTPDATPELEEADYFTRSEISKVFSLAQALPHEGLGVDPILPSGVPKERKFGDVNFRFGLEVVLSHIRKESPDFFDSRRREGSLENEYGPDTVRRLLDSIADGIRPKSSRRGITKYGFTDVNVARVRELLSQGRKDQLISAYDVLVEEAILRRSIQ